MLVFFTVTNWLLIQLTRLMSYIDIRIMNCKITVCE
jgi:hypothetical protein